MSQTRAITASRRDTHVTLHRCRGDSHARAVSRTVLKRTRTQSQTCVVEPRFPGHRQSGRAGAWRSGRTKEQHMTTGSMETAQQDVRELTANEIDSVDGAAQFDLNLGLIRFHLSVTSDGITGSYKVAGGSWHGGTIWF